MRYRATIRFDITGRDILARMMIAGLSVWIDRAVSIMNAQPENEGTKIVHWELEKFGRTKST